MSRKSAERELLYTGTEACELGQVRWVGISRMAASVETRPASTPHWVSKSYALLFVRRGAGRYHGLGPQPLSLARGDLFFLFPGLPFRYTISRRQIWEENFVVFNGPVFDLWRETGVLDPQHPVWRPALEEDWSAKIRALADPPPGGVLAPLVLVSRLTNLLAQARVSSQSAIGKDADAEPAWLQTGKWMLEDHARHALSLHAVATHAGMTYDAFRKQFLKRTGSTPARYRMEKRLAAARDLLEHTPLSIKEIAAGLGFSSTFHFSEAFLKAYGVRPSTARKSVASRVSSRSLMR